MTVDDAHEYPIYPLKALRDPILRPAFSIGAIAAEFKVWKSHEEWKDTQTPISTVGSPIHDMIPDFPDELFMAPEFATSPWLFDVYAGRASAMQANSAAQLRAVCNKIVVARNHLNGGEWLKVDANCGFPLTVAIPIDAPVRPEPGSLLDGRFVLTGTSSVWAQVLQNH